MADIAGLPFTRIEFDKTGNRTNAGPLRPTGITDLIVISHGWHMDDDDAEPMYRTLIGNMVAEAGKSLSGRKFGVAGVFWPSDKFKDDLTLETKVGASGHGASVTGGGDLSQPDLERRIREVAALLNLSKAHLLAQAQAAKAGGPAADTFIDTLRNAVSRVSADDETKAEHEDFLSKTPGREILNRLKAPPAPPQPKAAGGGAAALGVGGILKGVKKGINAALAQALNQAAYFELKTRAGVIGEALGRLLEQDGLSGVQLNLVGHSFGARLVTAATSRLTNLKPHSLVLLQGAFSHNSLGVNIGPKKVIGGYRNVVRDSKVAGPVVITHTWNDSAVGFWYALASRASNDYAKAFVTDTFGGVKDLFGGMGANGALNLENGEGSDAPFDGVGMPALKAGSVNSLHCDFIENHGDVTRAEVARVLLAAVK